MSVDHISLSTTLVFLYRDDVLISQGTGFFYVHEYPAGRVLFLVTNHHVVTGSPPLANEAPLGNKIAFQFHVSTTHTGSTKTITLPLYTKDGKPIYISNPTCGEADVTLIPVMPSLFRDCDNLKCIAPGWADADLRVRAASNVVLVGYPYGICDGQNALPIWKSGTIASEPSLDFDGKPCFLIDASAFPGMSGSPVFAIACGAYERQNGTFTVGTARKFLGIFASMQMHTAERYVEVMPADAKLGIVHQESLQLGFVWKADLILSMAEAVNIEDYVREIAENL